MQDLPDSSLSMGCTCFKIHVDFNAQMNSAHNHWSSSNNAKNMCLRRQSMYTLRRRLQTCKFELPNVYWDSTIGERQRRALACDFGVEKTGDGVMTGGMYSLLCTIGSSVHK